MARKKRVYDDDDGRTVADMSGVERTPLIVPRLPDRKNDAPESAEQPDRPWEQQTLTKGERRSVVLGAMSASVLIALIFIVVFAIAIALIMWFVN